MGPEEASSVSFFTLFKFSTRDDVLLMSISLLASSMAGMLTPVGIMLVASVFQTMITYDRSVQTRTNDDEEFLNAIHKFGLHYSLVGAAMFLGGYLGTTPINIAAINQIFRIRQEYLKAALNQDAEYFDQYETGDFASKMSDDVVKLEQGIGEKVSTFVYNITIAISCVVMALVKGWKLALLCLITSPITAVILALFSKFANSFSKQEAVQTGLASAVAEEVLSSVRTVYAFNGQDKEIQRYNRPLAAARTITFKKELFSALSLGFLTFCIFSSYGISFYFGIYLILNEPETYNADVMFAVFFGVITGMSNFGMVAELVGTFGSARGAAAQIVRLVNNVPKINPLLDRGIKHVPISGEIQFKNVIFTYPTRPEVKILQSLCFTINQGQSVALVGQSGCGKSTVIQLICRFYDVNGGSVNIDGHDVRELSVRWLRAQIGLVGQEPVLFNTSVRENIRYGREDASHDDVEQAARQANAHHFIVKLPQGYDTLVGERGTSLSGGQKQRIAIARALVRNPKILLLDEATSALDTASEAVVQQALEKASKNRTTVTVAHRLSTIRNVDQIYVLKDGVIVENGTHEELMKFKGLYYDMLLLQEPSIQSGTQEETSGVSANNNVAGATLTPRDSRISKESDTSENEFPAEQYDMAVDAKKKPDISFRRVLALNAPEWKLILVGCIFGFIQGFAIPILVVIIGDFFGSLSNPNPEVLKAAVYRVSILCVTSGVVIGVASFIETLCFGVAGAKLTERLRVVMFTHLLQQPMAFFDQRRNSTGALCARLSAEAAHVQGATGQRVSILIQAIGCVSIALLLALLYEWRVALVSLTFMPLVGAVMYYEYKISAQKSARDAETVENSSKVAIEAVSNYWTVAALGREPGLLREYAAQLAPALVAGRRAAHLRGVVAGLARCMFNFVNAAAFTYGGHRIVSDDVAYKNILVTTQTLQFASAQVQNAFSFAPDFQRGVAAASRVRRLLSTRPAIQDPADPDVTDFKARGDISFNDVEFTYPTRPGVRVLRGLNLHVESSKTVALVGSSGCGKSTVIQLLQRYYDPDGGFVALDGYALPELRLCELRSNLGLVSQEPVLFDLSVARNIAYGDNSRDVPMHEVIDAAKQANIHDFVVTLPEGYETNIGKKGTQLSGGQKQRVAIARALVRRPRVLLLDEATSALDTESEKVVQEALDAAKAGRTCVVIAHRLSTVRDADAICVVHGGRVAEQGTHHQLMDLKKLYYNLNRRGYS